MPCQPGAKITTTSTTSSFLEFMAAFRAASSETTSTPAPLACIELRTCCSAVARVAAHAASIFCNSFVAIDTSAATRAG
eukprot:3877121-Amphidinium_carterae.1